MLLKRSLSLVAVAVIVTASALPVFAVDNVTFPISRWQLTGNSMYYEMVYENYSGITVSRTSYIQWFLPLEGHPLPPDFSVSQTQDSFNISVVNPNNDVAITVRVTSLEIFGNSSSPIITNQEYILAINRGLQIFSVPGVPLAFRSFGTDDGNPFIIDSDYTLNYDSNGADLTPIITKLNGIEIALDSIDSSSLYISYAVSDIYNMLDEIRWNELNELLVDLYQINSKLDSILSQLRSYNSSVLAKLDSILEALGSAESLTQPTIPNHSKYDELEQELIEGTVPNFSQYSEQVTVNGNALSLVIQLFDDIVHINPAVFSLVIISLVVGIITLVLGRNKQ